MLGNVQFTSFSYFYFSIFFLFAEILSSNAKLVVVMFNAERANWDYTDIVWRASKHSWKALQKSISLALNFVAYFGPIGKCWKIL